MKGSGGASKVMRQFPCSINSYASPGAQFFEVHPAQEGIGISVPIPLGSNSGRARNTYIHIYICRYRCVYVCVYIYIYIYLYLYLCLSLSLSICIYIYIYIYTPFREAQLVGRCRCTGSKRWAPPACMADPGVFPLSHNTP